jgi:tetratricopeptide (TPR) repeat protein
MAFDVFICYPHQNKTVADAACAKLEGAGVRCWIAPRDITPSAEWAASIIDAIDQCRLMVLIFSVHSNRSKQVHREVQRAFDGEKPVIPFRIDDILPDKSLAYYMGAVHWLDALTAPLESHLEKLVAAVSRILQVDPSRSTQPVPYHAAFGHPSRDSYEQGIAHENNRRYSEAIQCFDDALRQHPRHVAAYFHRGQCLFLSGDKLRALDDFNNALAIDPNEVGSLFGRANTLRSLGRLQESTDGYGAVTRLMPTRANAFIERGRTWTMQGDNRRAIADFDEAIKRDGNSAEAFYLRGLARKNMGDEVRAREDLDFAARLDPRYASTG